MQNLMLSGDLGHRSVTQLWYCNAGQVFAWCSHVLECRVGIEKDSVQQFSTQRRIYKKHHLTRVDKQDLDSDGYCEHTALCE